MTANFPQDAPDPQPPVLPHQTESHPIETSDARDLETGADFVRPQPSLRTVKYISSLRHLVIAGIATAVLWALGAFFEVHAPGWVWALCIAPWVLFWVLALVKIPLFMRNHGYSLNEDDYMVTTGAWFRTVTSIPYGRIQYSTVSQGPLLRRFGLASVELSTAASLSGATVQGLTLEDAEALKERLVARGNARLAGM